MTCSLLWPVTKILVRGQNWFGETTFVKGGGGGTFGVTGHSAIDLPNVYSIWIMNNDHPPTCKSSKWLMRNNNSSLSVLMLKLIASSIHVFVLETIGYCRMKVWLEWLHCEVPGTCIHSVLGNRYKHKHVGLYSITGITLI